MNYLIEGIFVVINVVTAWWQYHLIANSKKIAHWAWALLYAGFMGLAYWLTGNILVAAAGLLIREVVFAQTLNFFRHLPFFYTNPSGTSLLDNVQGSLYVPIYILSWVCLIVLQIYLH